MTGESTISLQELRERIGQQAKSVPTHRFWGMYVHVVKRSTLEAAYRDAKRQDGAAGTDGQTFAQIEAAGREGFIEELQAELQAGTYSPRSYRRHEIPKAGGRVRVISIPAIRDRVVQGAVRLILEPIFEADFSPSSYGARPGRSAHQALAQVQQALLVGRHRVVELDLASFFDSLRQDRILEKVAKRVRDGQVLRLIKQFLRSGGKRGLPQGSPLSPLLANLALNDLDHALDRGKGFLTYVRYLDDMVVLVPDSPRGRRWAERARERIREEAAALGVSLNEEKSQVLGMTEEGSSFAFLGFVFRWVRSARTGNFFPCRTPRPERVTELLRRVRELLRHIRHLRMREAVAAVNSRVRGWVAYFRVGHSARTLQALKYRIEIQVRRFAAKKHKRGGFGWKRWNSELVYGVWGLFNDYRVRWDTPAKVAAGPKEA
jgi:RNA-directed DNA polymerase